MSRTARAIENLALAVLELADQQRRTAAAMSDQVREQRTTNLLVRSQITTNAVEKQRLMAEASRRMDTARRRAPKDPEPLSTPSTRLRIGPTRSGGTRGDPTA